MEAKDTVMGPEKIGKILDYFNDAMNKASAEGDIPPEIEDLLKRIAFVQAEVSFKAGENAKEEALKATGKYCRLHRTVQPEGYKQPIRAPGWVVFIPDTKEVSND